MPTGDFQPHLYWFNEGDWHSCVPRTEPDHSHCKRRIEELERNLMLETAYASHLKNTLHNPRSTSFLIDRVDYRRGWWRGINAALTVFIAWQGLRGLYFLAHHFGWLP